MADANKNLSPRDYFHVGEILAAHGVHGEVKVRLLSSDANRLKGLRDCYLTDRGESSYRQIRINNAREIKGFWLLTLQDVDDRESAEKLRGQLLSVSRDQAIPLGDNEWFVADLIGCEVHDLNLGNIGRLTDILDHPDQDIYVVSQPGEKDVLFPARKNIILDVDLERKRIHVNLPEGLFEIYRELKRQ